MAQLQELKWYLGCIKIWSAVFLQFVCLSGLCLLISVKEFGGVWHCLASWVALTCFAAFGNVIGP